MLPLSQRRVTVLAIAFLLSLAPLPAQEASRPPAGYTKASFDAAAKFEKIAIDTPTRVYYLVVVYLFLAYLACRVLVRSHFGQVLVAIRENEDRARFLGYNVHLGSRSPFRGALLMTAFAADRMFCVER